MLCPYCQKPLAEDAAACGVCGLSLARADAYFGTPPRLSPDVTDPAGLLTASARQRIIGALDRFHRRFPQCRLGVALLSMPDEMPGATRAFWLFNRGAGDGGLNTGSANRRLFLLIDPDAGEATLTIGYGLEPFIGPQHLEAVLTTAADALARAEWATAVETAAHQLESLMRRIIAGLPRTFGLSPHIGDGARGTESAPAH